MDMANMPIEDQILQTVYDTSPDAIIIIDEKALICSFHKTAENLFHFSAQEVIGKQNKVLMSPYFAAHNGGDVER